MQPNWTQTRKRLMERYPTGAIPRQDLPTITGYKASYFAAMAARNEGPEYYYQGRLCMYPITSLVRWIQARCKEKQS